MITTLLIVVLAMLSLVIVGVLRLLFMANLLLESAGHIKQRLFAQELMVRDLMFRLDNLPKMIRNGHL